MRCLFDLKLRPIDVTVSTIFGTAHMLERFVKAFFSCLNFLAMTWKTQKRLQGAVTEDSMRVV